MYVSDSLSTTIPKIWWRDAANLLTSPVSVTDPAGNLFFHQYSVPSWGPDVNSDGNADSILAISTDDFGRPVGPAKLEMLDSGNSNSDIQWLASTAIQDPDWSPNGQYVAFAMKSTGASDRDIWIINAHSSDLSTALRVTSGPADDSQPRFSEDGNKIYFVSNRVDHYGANGVQGIERRGRNIWSVAEFDKP
jgi:dipeptidyl aminopeptidase/acylaminoacyl peptidase